MGEREYDPWVDAASRPQLVVGVTDLPVGLGWWWPAERAILLDASLDAVEVASVLAHELAHADHGHVQVARVGPDGARQAGRQERQADATAAARMISLTRLADALAVHVVAPEVAAALGVTEHLLRRRCADLSGQERAWVERRVLEVEQVA